MIAALSKIKDFVTKVVTTIFDGLSGSVDDVFAKTFSLVRVMFDEVFALTEWAFRVGTRIMLLYLTYQLVFDDLMDKILESL